MKHYCEEVQLLTGVDERVNKNDILENNKKLIKMCMYSKIFINR